MMNKLLDYTSSNWRILLVFFCLWFGLLTITGSLFSGYHMEDDHEIIQKIHSPSQNQTKLNLEKVLSEKNRFRPFYFVHRIAQTHLFSDNFILWSIYTALLAVFTSFFLFLFMKETGFANSEAFLFAFLTLLGEQAAVWWRLGTNETFGMFALSITLLFMAKEIHSKKSISWLYQTLFIIFAIITSLCKESFILLIPAILFWKILLEYNIEYKIENNKGLSDASHPTPFYSRLVLVLKRHSVSIGILTLICITELIYIKKYVGTTGINYAGYEGFSINKFIQTTLRLFIYSHGWLIFFALFALLFIFLRGKANEKRKLIPLLVLFVLIVLPQVILYMKSGIGERYLLPGVLGYALLIVYLLKEIRIKTTKQETTIPSIAAAYEGKLPFHLLSSSIVAVSLTALVLDMVISINWSFDIAAQRKWIMSATGIATLVVWLLLMIVSSIRTGIRKKLWSNIFNHKTLTRLLVAAVAVNIIISTVNAYSFATEGRHINQWFQSIQQHTQKDDQLLLITESDRYFEWSYSTQTYLELKLNRPNLYTAPVTLNPKNNSFFKTLNKSFLSRHPGFSLKNNNDRSQIKTILIFPHMEKDFLHHAGNYFKLDSFERYQHDGGFVSYQRKTK